jgi:hypothetical protein
MSLLPAAVLSLPKPIDIYRVIALQAQYPGVYGYVVFGEEINNLDSFFGRFSTPGQSVVVPKAARPYADLPISSVGVPEAGSGLTGLVKLTAQAPLEIVKETREIDNIVRDAVVIRLVQPIGQATNVFQQFTGACGGRPESNTCSQSAVEFINNVAPDCAGTLTLKFAGAIDVASTTPIVGAVVDGTYGLAETCLNKNQVPTADGKLPNQYPNLCNLLVSSQNLEVSLPPWPPVQTHGHSTLPYTDDFDACVARDFLIIQGGWTFTSDDSPDQMLSEPPNGPSQCPVGSTGHMSLSTETTIGASVRNIDVWTGNGQTSGVEIITDFNVQQGPIGALHNAGIILNYRPHQTDADRYVYYLVQVDYDAQALQLWFFNGTQFVLIGSVPLVGMLFGVWYRVFVIVRPGLGSGVTIQAQVLSLIDGSINVTFGPVAVNSYLPATGYNGLESNRSFTRFSFWHANSVA